MTSAPTPPRDPDELASALLDGDLAPHEAEAAQRDPAVRRQLDAMRAARETLRSTDPGAADGMPRAAARSATIARALAAFDAADAVAPRDADADADAEVTRPAAPIAAGTTDAVRRVGRWHPRRWLSAAAVVLVLAGMVALLSRTTTHDAEDTSAASDMAAENDAARDATDGDDPRRKDAHGEEAAEMHQDPPGEGVDEDAAVAQADGWEPVDLGSPASPAALVVRATRATEVAGSSPLADSPALGPLPHAGDAFDPAACRAARTPGQGPLEGAVPLLEMTAVLDVERVDVWAYADEGALRIVALDAGCHLVVNRVADD
jgi:hypothetical protein